MNTSFRGISLGLAVAGLASAAHAADLPTSSPAPPTPPPEYTWAGRYFGAHIGYMWGTTSVVDTGVLVEPGAPTDGFIGGLLGGYNWQNSAWVYGLEIDGSIAGVHGNGAVASSGFTYDLNWAANLRGRLGYSVTPTTLLYAAGGLAVTDVRFTEVSAIPIGVVRAGWTIGGGVDHAFTSNLVGRLEYLYADYGHVRYNLSPSDWYDVGFTAQTLRAALIWKF